MKKVVITVSTRSNIVTAAKEFASRIALSEEMKAMKAVIECGTNPSEVIGVTYIYANGGLINETVIGGFDVRNGKCIDRAELRYH